MKKILIGFLIISFVSLFIYGAYEYFDYILSNEDIPIINNGKDINKQEYVYKEDLLLLGYTISDIEIIKSKISNNDVKTYLLEKKYNNLTKFLTSPYFKLENIERYENYYSKNSKYTSDEVVLYVEIGLDYEFYTHVVEITNYNDIDSIVNKYYKLPSNFTPEDLVSLDTNYTKGKYRLRKEAATKLYEMIDSAKKDNITLKVVSAYRTESTQRSLFNNSKNKDGLEHALIYSAKPGHSEHQLGLAVDLNMASSKAGFEKTKEYKWLQNNSYKYGFIERYKKGKEFITGYGFEPWHYRYFGVDLATNLYKEDITYEEYLVKHAK